MRGKHVPSKSNLLIGGNIPAYAGKTPLTQRQCRWGKEHPRVCGENGRVWGGSTCGFGTSPRMRGKRHYRYQSELSLRNIPAYAGKTGALRIVVKRWKEHPRVCGENNRLNTNAVNAPGTSPRMRGKRFGARHGMFLSRNIPAYAGKTDGSTLHPGRGQEHPRVCGENSSVFTEGFSSAGTSPRMRGKRTLTNNYMLCVRNIPAYAGKTDMFLSYIFCGGEHPRVCGENRQWATHNGAG